MGPPPHHPTPTADRPAAPATVARKLSADNQQISVEKDGQTLAQATVSAPDENNEVRAHVHVASGHLPVGTRQKLVEAVHEVVNDGNARRLTATVPLGDAELVEGIRGHLHDVELRASRRHQHHRGRREARLIARPRRCT